MRLLSLMAQPNQELSLTVNGSTWRLRIISLLGQYAADVYRDDELIIAGSIITPNGYLLPYKYMRAHGDFVLDSGADNELDFTKFGTSQNLYYLDPSEIA